MMFLTLPNFPGGSPSVPSRISVVLVDEANAGGGSVHVRINICGRWLARRSRKAGLCMMAALDRRARGGRCSLPMLPVDVADTPTLSAGGPRSVPSRISVVLVDGTKAGGTPGRECPREDRDLRPLAGVTRPAGVSVCGGDVGLPCVGGTLSSLDVAGRLLPVVLTGESPQLVL